MKMAFKIIATGMFLGVFLAINSFAQANDETQNSINILAPSLEVEPQRCVALHQGQICYQTAILKWHTPITGHYCLYSSRDVKALQCWQGNRSGDHTLEFQSPKSLTFRLRNMDLVQDIVQTKLTVAWVYGNEKRRRTSWRLF